MCDDRAECGHGRMDLVIALRRGGTSLIHREPRQGSRNQNRHTTMPTQSIDPAPAATIVAQYADCPLCGTHLDPAHPTECPRCDWTQGYRREREKPIGNARDIAAVLLTVIPGL